MELREWLIILGLALVSLIVVDGVRRLQRQRRVPRLDQAVKDLPTAKLEELDDEAKEAEINWELPNGVLGGQARRLQWVGQNPVRAPRASRASRVLRFVARLPNLRKAKTCNSEI